MEHPDGGKQHPPPEKRGTGAQRIEALLVTEYLHGLVPQRRLNTSFEKLRHREQHADLPNQSKILKKSPE
jgi:hypothetical protein